MDGYTRKNAQLTNELSKENMKEELKLMISLTTNMLNLSFTNKILYDDKKISNNIIKFFDCYEFKTILCENLNGVIIKT